MFEHIERGGPDSWIALHSLGLSNHAHKPVAEADFVLVTPDGVLVLEVKGGAIARTNRTWTTNSHPLKESPFDQAGGAASALFNDLAASVAAIRKSVVGHGVCFPDIRFEVSGTDIEEQLVFDQRDRTRPFSDYVDRVLGYWHARVNRRDRRPLSPSDMAAIVDRLAVDFNLVPSLGGHIEDTVDRLIRLSDEQAMIFGSLADNDRVFVTGGAGTGKTLLACAEARRVAREGRTALVVCHSNALAGFLRKSLVDVPLVDVRAYHSLTGEFIRAGGVEDPRPRGASGEKEYFRVLRPMAAREGWDRIAEAPVWDVLIVDEAQDLLSEAAVDFLGVLVRDGLGQGNWRVFADLAQDVFSAGEEGVLESLAALSTRWRLSTNCRNTREIALHTAIATRTRMAEVRPVAGPAVEWIRYADADEQRKKIVGQLRSWNNAGLRGEQIVILSEVRLPNSVLASGLPRGSGYRMIESAERGAPDEVRFSTVAGFKGLEEDAVLFIDPSLRSEQRTSSVYVGMTRARASLAIMRPSASDAVWDELETEFARTAFGE